MKKSDITRNQLREIVCALPTDQWQVRMVPSDTAPHGARTTPACYTTGQFISSYKYIRHMNANGCHIYGRPMSNWHVLVDDLCEDAIDQLFKDGLRPSVIVETSPDNYQAWITVAPEPINDNLARAVAVLLASRYGGDLNSTGRNQLGRLPGFTNRKLMYEDKAGHYPFTRLLYPRCPHPFVYRRMIAPASERLLRDAEQCASEILPSSTLGSGVLNNTQSKLSHDEAVTSYCEAEQSIYEQFGIEQFKCDRSRLDYAIAQHLMLRGMPKEDCIAALLAGSDKARERGIEYVEMTVSKLSDLC